MLMLIWHQLHTSLEFGHQLEFNHSHQYLLVFAEHSVNLNLIRRWFEQSVATEWSVTPIILPYYLYDTRRTKVFAFVCMSRRRRLQSLIGDSNSSNWLLTKWKLRNKLTSFVHHWWSDIIQISIVNGRCFIKIMTIFFVIIKAICDH